MQKIKCPHCSQQISDDGSLSGKVVKCPHCCSQFKMPAYIVQEPKWFVALDKKKLGPFTQAQFKQMVSSGQVQTSTMVLREGDQRWTTAGSVERLFPTPVTNTPQDIPVAKFAPPVPRQQEFGTINSAHGPKSSHPSVGWTALAKKTLRKRWLIAGLAGISVIIVLGVTLFWTRMWLAPAPTEREAHKVVAIQPPIETGTDNKSTLLPINPDQRLTPETPPVVKLDLNNKPPSYWIDALKSNEPDRSRAIEALAKIGTPAVSELRLAVKDGDPQLACAAIKALGKIGPAARESVPTLIVALASPSLRGDAADALGEMGPVANEATGVLVYFLDRKAPGTQNFLNAITKINPKVAGLCRRLRELDLEMQILDSKERLEEARLKSAEASGSVVGVQNAANELAAVALRKLRVAEEAARVAETMQQTLKD